MIQIIHTHIYNIYVYIYIHIHTNTHMYVTYTRIYTYIHIHIYTYSRTNTHTHIYMCIYIYICIYYICINTYSRKVNNSKPKKFKDCFVFHIKPTFVIYFLHLNKKGSTVLSNNFIREISRVFN